MGKRTVVPKGKQRVRVAEGIYLKASRKYQATFRDPGGRQHWREFKTKSEAEAWRHKGKVDPRSVIGGRRTLSEVWAQFIDHHGSRMRPTTVANWKQEFTKHIEPVLGSWPIGKITVPVIKEFLADLERDGVGAPTRAKCRSVLHRLFEESIENQELSANPAAARGTRVRQPQRRKARILSAEEVARVLGTAREAGRVSDALAIEVMFFVGLRVGEMAGLQARDVDLRSGEITICRTVTDSGGRLAVQDATKTNRYRVLPVPTELPVWGHIVEHMQARGLIGGAQVFSSTGGGLIRPNNWRRRVWDRVMADAGIDEPPTPHSGRRTTASLLAHAGVPPMVVQAILGHSTLQQTGEYVDVPRSEIEGAFRLLAQTYGAS